jgi:hypothetical protein
MMFIQLVLGWTSAWDLAKSSRPDWEDICKKVLSLGHHFKRFATLNQLISQKNALGRRKLTLY